MPTPKALIRTTAVLTVVNLLAAVVWAGPVLFDNKTKLPDEIRSLAAIERVRLRIDPFPAEMEELGVRRETILQKWRQRLRKAGFILTEDTSDPELHLVVDFLTDDQVKDAAAFSLIFYLKQPAHVPSVDADLVVPTYSRSLMGLEAKPTLRNPLEGSLLHLVETFIKQHQIAVANR